VEQAFHPAPFGAEGDADWKVCATRETAASTSRALHAALVSGNPATAAKTRAFTCVSVSIAESARPVIVRRSISTQRARLRYGSLRPGNITPTSLVSPPHVAV